MASCTRCRPTALFLSLILVSVAGAIGLAVLPPEWREPLTRSLIGMTGAAFALILGVMLLVLVEGAWSRYFAPHVRSIRGACVYRGEVVYGWRIEDRNLLLITRRDRADFKAHTVKARMFAQSRTIKALQREGVPYVAVDCDAIGRGILRWGEQLELWPLLEKTGLLNPHHAVFGRTSLRPPEDDEAWRDFCRILWRQPAERSLALMLATQCRVERD